MVGQLGGNMREESKAGVKPSNDIKIRVEGDDVLRRAEQVAQMATAQIEGRRLASMSLGTASIDSSTPTPEVLEEAARAAVRNKKKG